MSTQRNILAAILIFGIFMLIPQYMEMIGVVPEMEYDDGNGSQAARQTGPQVDTYSATPSVPEKNHLHSAGVSEILTIITPLYKANISSYGGGSVVYYKIHETKNQTQRYVGGYDSLGVYSKSQQCCVASRHWTYLRLLRPLPIR